MQILPMARPDGFVTIKQQGIDGVILTAYFPNRARNIVVGGKVSREVRQTSKSLKSTVKVRRQAWGNRRPGTLPGLFFYLLLR